MATNWIYQRTIVLENCNHDIITIRPSFAYDFSNKDKPFKNQYLEIDMFRKGVRTSYISVHDVNSLSIENLGHCLRLVFHGDGYSMLYLENYNRPIKVRLGDCDIWYSDKIDASKKRDRVKPEWR